MADVAPRLVETPQIKRRNLVHARAKGSSADNGHFIIGMMITLVAKGVAGPSFHQDEDGPATYANAIASLWRELRPPTDPADSLDAATACATTWGPVGNLTVVVIVVLLIVKLESTLGPFAPLERGGVTTALRRYLLVSLISNADLGLRAHMVMDPGTHAQSYRQSQLATSPPPWTRGVTELATSSSGSCRGSAGQPGCTCRTSTTRCARRRALAAERGATTMATAALVWPTVDVKSEHEWEALMLVLESRTPRRNGPRRKAPGPSSSGSPGIAPRTGNGLRGLQLEGGTTRLGRTLLTTPPTHAWRLRREFEGTLLCLGPREATPSAVRGRGWPRGTLSWHNPSPTTPSAWTAAAVTEAACSSRRPRSGWLPCDAASPSVRPPTTTARAWRWTVQHSCR